MGRGRVHPTAAHRRSLACRPPPVAQCEPASVAQEKKFMIIVQFSAGSGSRVIVAKRGTCTGSQGYHLRCSRLILAERSPSFYKLHRDVIFSCRCGIILFGSKKVNLPFHSNSSVSRVVVVSILLLSFLSVMTVRHSRSSFGNARRCTQVRQILQQSICYHPSV